MQSCGRKLFAVSNRFMSVQVKQLVQPVSPISQALKYCVGDKIFGYTVTQVDEVPELQLAAVRLSHEKTGADHLHIARKDKNNLFSVSLRTPTRNNKGVFHILEHLSLCGSQRFPCRDPFFKMRNRSLSTFMNAFTGCDFTMYPFSSQNAKDFDNLLQVYLDAVYFPQLREMDFWQEAWRIEHEDVSAKTSPLTFKGVVFNEMKGVFSDSSQYYARNLLNKLYPSDAYSFENGGIPVEITNLTLEELKAFHSEYYHPSNSRFFTYGDLPLEIHLESIENYVLKHFSKLSMNHGVKMEVPWTKPREEHITCQFDPMVAVPEKHTTASVSYLLNDITDTFETFSLAVLGNLLTDGPNAPFYKTLLEPGIGADYSPWSGYEGSFKQAFYSIGLREIQESDTDLVRNIIESTFNKVIKDGFPEERIKGVLHNIELSLKHQTTSFGLHCAHGVNSVWNHGGDPIVSMKVNEHVQWFQEQLKRNPLFLQEKVDQYFLKNQHKLSLIMTPDKDFGNKLKTEEQTQLQSKISSLTDDQVDCLFSKGIELAKYQEEPQDMSCLPTLKISDVQKNMEFTDLQHEIVAGVPVQLCEQPTNDITYFSALSKVPLLSEDLLMLLPLFSTIATKMGTNNRNFKELDQEAELTTGGLSARIHISEHPSLQDAFELGVLFGSHCLNKNIEKMMSLWEDIFNNLTLHDQDRLSQLIKMIAADLAQSIPHSGHKYTMVKAASPLSLCLSIKEKLSGLTQVQFMKKLAEMSNYDDVIRQLHTLASIVLNKENLRCSVNANLESMPSSFSSVEHFINSIKKKEGPTADYMQESTFKATDGKFHFILPFAVNYVGKCLLTVPYNHEDFASLKTAVQLLSFKFLHSEIREKGGAYGGGATVNQSGALMFYSYRDPNVQQTLNCFSSGVQWLLNGDYTASDIDEAKLGVFSDVDHPVAPGDKGSSQFLHGITDQMRQELRKNLFKVTKEDVKSVTERYLLNGDLRGLSLIGPENEMTKNSGEWTLYKE